MSTPVGSGESIIQAWLKELERQGKSHHTIAAYRRALDHFTRWYGTVYKVPFDAGLVMSRDVRDWQAHQQTVERATPATINQRLAALSRFFAWAMAQKLVREDPTTNVHAQPLPPRKPKGISARDLRRLLRAAKGHLRDYALIEVLAGTGLRVQELLDLRIGDVTLAARSGRVTVRHGKRGAYREVPLTTDVRKALRDYLDTHPERGNPGAFLWVGTQGPLQHRSSVVRILDKYAYQAGIDRVNPHALRHTFASRYLEANPDDLRGLAKLLGHANLNTVMVYTEPDLDDLAERMERVDAG